MRIGHGYDVHRLTGGRKLILCGVELEYDKGLKGHSDADAAVHALMDAILGAQALGDIGHHFPSDDPEYEGVSSIKLLGEVMDMTRKNGYTVINADITIVAEKPKLSPYVWKMRTTLAEAMGIETDRVSVKATTEEGLGKTGRGEAISATAVCLVDKL